MRSLVDFYKVGYIFDGKERWAVYFDIVNAQEAMIKMMSRGVNVIGLESQKIVMGDNLRGVHRTPRVRD